MSIHNANQIIDADGNVAADSSWHPFRCEKLVTFTGGTTDAWGDDGGALDGGAVFTVTGTVRMRVFAVVETDLVGAATIELGITGSTASVLAQVANATGMDAGQIWHDATVDAKTELSSVAIDRIIANGLDIILTVGSTNITAGAIRFFCSWIPVSEDGMVTPSNN